jgi:hypothetical protein
MALQSSGKITLKEIAAEFEDTAPHSLKEFYGVASGIPASGTITIKDFYGASNAYSFTMASGDIQEANIRSLAVADGWDQSVPLIVTINSGTTLYSRSTSTGGAIVSGSFPNGVTILNSGAITGMGGSAGQNGGPALQITTSDSVKVTNKSGAFIAGGGGGGAASQGGGGAGQSLPRVSTAGVGGPYTTTQGISGTLAVFGCSEGGTVVVTGSCSVSVSGNRGYGADQGAYAGSGTTSGGCCSASGTGSSGTGCTSSASGTLCGGGGSPNPGGTGGSVLSATSNVTNSGGGWGAAGTGTGAGSGGAAISGTYTNLTNNGTIYGST